MGLAHHADAHFIETCIAQRNGGISAIKQFIDGLRLSSDEPERRAAKGSVPHRKWFREDVRVGSVSPRWQSSRRSSRIFQNLSISPSDDTGNIYQVDGNNALIESSVKFVAAVSIALGIFHSQEGAAAHTRINLAFF